jgi:hypothetical protein
MRVRTVAIAAACFLGLGLPALGQSISERIRPDYDAKGLPMGGFRLYPTLDLTAVVDDNVYRRPNKQSDTYFLISPSLALRSEWTNHALNFFAGLDHYAYSKLTKEDRTNWNLGADGRLDIQRGSSLTGRAVYISTHEQRFSPDQPGFAASPTPYKVLQASGSLTFQPVDFGVQVGGTVDKFDFDSTRLIGGGVLNNNDRDRTAYTAFARLFYQFSPGYSAFVRAIYDTRDFRRQFDRTGVNRDSNGYRIQGGLSMLVTQLITGEIYGGYMHQDFKAPLRDVSGGSYGAALTWFPTDLLTVRLNAVRAIGDTTIASASASDDRHVDLSVEYDLLRNVVLQGTVGYTDSRFTGSNREDQYTTAGVTVMYLINNYLRANAGYVYDHRNSSLAGQDYTDNVFRFGLTGQM